MTVNPYRLNRKELLKFFCGRCKHGHKYHEHPNCFTIESNKPLKVGYLDIEAGGLKANFDYMLTYCIKTRGKEEYKTGVIDVKDIRQFKFDKNLIKQLINDISDYDVIVTYYGTRYDIPFIRTRALHWKHDFPQFGFIQHKDVYYMVKSKLCLHRNSLDAATNFLGIKGKNHLDGMIWNKAEHGDTKSLDYVLDHNIRDCVILEKLHKKLELFARKTTKSI